MKQYDQYDVRVNGLDYVRDEEGNPVYYPAAVAMMDDEIREELHVMCDELTTKQDFYDLYQQAHTNKFGEPFVVG